MAKQLPYHTIHEIFSRFRAAEAEEVVSDATMVPLQRQIKSMSRGNI